MIVRLYQGKDLAGLAPLVKDFVEQSAARHGQSESVALRDAAVIIRAWTRLVGNLLFVLDTDAGIGAFARVRQEGDSFFVEELWADRGRDVAAASRDLLAGIEAYADDHGASALHFQYRFASPFGLDFLAEHGFDYLGGLDLVKPFGAIVESTTPVVLLGVSLRRPVGPP